MYCVYHSTNPATVRCTHCSRPLCQSCDHRVRGFPFCQDCIVAGVEVLQQQTRFARPTETRRRSSPIIAALLSVIVPGLGAAYNGQTSKAIFHFALFASFFQLSAVSQAAPIFVWGVFGTWLFATVDAYRTAQLIRAGLAPKDEEDAIARRLYGNPLTWGAMLIALGVLILLHTVFNISLPVREALPAALIAVGAYMAADYFRRRRAKRLTAELPFGMRPPPSVVEAARAGSFSGAEMSARPVERLPFKP